MSTITVPTSTLDGDLSKSIRQTIANFLRRCGLQYIDVTLDEAYHSECCQEAIKRGFPMDGKYSIRTYMDAGVAMGSFTYAHLPDPARMWMSLFTAVVTRIDDMVDNGEDMVDVCCFNERFVNRQPQGNPMMNMLDVILREITCLHSPLASDLITTSALNFMSSNCLDNETRDMQISPQVPLYAQYSRELSGLADGYALFIFPSMLPIRQYIQCMPYLRNIVNHTNDILSFYKEEIQGDSINYLSLMATSRSITKQEVLQEIVEKTVQSHHSILECLRPHTEAYNAYISFFDGYVKFYAVLKRYKMKEIMREM
ncbi:isoprenoid synthase domain-containing protein [Suillus tomentosus]|nr:isoprenoid synthase domain-containing protein [Suillus tomentosus]